MVDADSKDGSSELIKEYSDLIDQKIIEKDKGIYDGMNKGVSIANGLYTIFINSGDELVHADISSLIDSEKSDIIYGDTSIQYPNGFERIAKAKPVSDLWKSLPFVHQSVMVKTHILKDFPFDLNYKYCSDYELFCRLESNGYSFFQIDAIIAQIEAGGLSDERRAEATEEVFHISSDYRALSEDQKGWFEKEIKKGSRVSRIKKLLPNFVVKLLLKMKYRK